MKGGVLIPSLIGLVLLYAAIPVAQAFPVGIDGLAGMLDLSVRTT